MFKLLHADDYKRKEAFLINFRKEVSRFYIHLMKYFSAKLKFKGYNIASKI